MFCVRLTMGGVLKCCHVVIKWLESIQGSHVLRVLDQAPAIYLKDSLDLIWFVEKFFSLHQATMLTFSVDLMCHHYITYFTSLFGLV